jgi:hypothetical protein
MSMHVDAILRKTLTANDLGWTGSHQVGIHVPKMLVPYMPALDERARNPDLWLDVRDGDAGWVSRWRYVHYNSLLFADGTRDEYRLLHVAGYLRLRNPVVGDRLEIIRSGERSLKVRIARGGDAPDVLILGSRGPWTVVRLGR